MFGAMIDFKEYLNNIKVGDVLTIESKPNSWSSQAGGNFGLYVVKYPYTFTIDKFIIDIIKNNGYLGEYTYIAIKDTNGHGWTIKSTNQKIFKLEVNRKSRIESLEL